MNILSRKAVQLLTNPSSINIVRNASQTIKRSRSRTSLAKCMAGITKSSRKIVLTDTCNASIRPCTSNTRRNANKTCPVNLIVERRAFINAGRIRAIICKDKVRIVAGTANGQRSWAA